MTTIWINTLQKELRPNSKTSTMSGDMDQYLKSYGITIIWKYVQCASNKKEKTFT